MATGYYLQDRPNPNTPQYGWGRSRVSGVIGVHTAENNTCFNGPDPGDTDVAGFISRRTDHGSYHVLADADSITPLVHPSWAAWADTTNNAHAMSVSAAVRANDWLAMTPARRQAVVINLAVGAAQMVQTAVRDGLLDAPTPARRISAAEAIAGSRAGFYGHGETNPGTRYDPGKDFDWNLFLSTYASAVGGSFMPVGTINPSEEDTMAGPFLIEANQAESIAQRAAVLIRENPPVVRLDPKQAEDIAQAAAARLLHAKIKRGGAVQGETSLAAMLAWNDDHVVQTLAAIGAAEGADGVSVEEIQEAVSQALKENVVNVDVNIKGDTK